MSTKRLDRRRESLFSGETSAEGSTAEDLFTLKLADVEASGAVFISAFYSTKRDAEVHIPRGDAVDILVAISP